MLRLQANDAHEVVAIAPNGADAVMPAALDLAEGVTGEIIADDLHLVTDAFADVLHFGSASALASPAHATRGTSRLIVARLLHSKQARSS